MKKPENIFDKALNYLEYQKDIFGDFSADLSKTETESESNGVVVEPNVAVQEPESEVESNQSTKVEEEALSSELSLENCTSLEELKLICLESDDLKTDLENTNLVFGVGNASADLMIIGEAPGENEDLQGEPFVGKAGQLLTKIIGAIGFSRDDVYIANILKHRPPDNRDPKAEERQQSLPYLYKQIELVDPKLILCVGKVAATTLLDKDDTLGNMRQKFHPFMGNRELMVTYHPAALLRNSNWKRPCWEDVQLLRKRYDELEGKP